jgi:autotransporter family porin
VSTRARVLIAVVAVAVVAAGVIGYFVVNQKHRNSPLPDDGYFTTLPPGAALPSDAECAERVHRSAWEPRPDNAEANRATPEQPLELADHSSFNEEWQQDYKTRITGDFTGTTDEIIQWAACKWGIADNVVRAQAVEESHWHMDAESDDEPRSNDHCAPDDDRDPCPTSFGILQIKWYFNPSTDPEGNSYPMSKTMTAFSLDYALASQRGCFEGLSFEGDKTRGDLWGCLGMWFSGEWDTDGGDAYVARVKRRLDAKDWLYWGRKVPAS